ncbi:Hypothetical predicted protein [Lecanosticta acicola]|uniref:F-box domain-containing protein n=1 Tax=Lecanosticta acicola TaxID=111012 RepID=A0AAI8YVJ7_9PEZI|nr:Hypothetical predicted protein [Lecanosticta acicola]
MASFRLFDLPREIRDEIYSYLTIDALEVQHGVDERDTGTYTFDAPLLPVLLSNRQLSAEYRDILPKHRRLLLQGAKCDFWTGYHPVPQLLANIVSDMTVYMHVLCFCDNLDEDEHEDQLNYPCDASIQVHSYAHDLDNYLNHFRNIEQVHVKMCMFLREDEKNYKATDSLEPPRLSHTVGFPRNLERLVALPGVKDLEIMGFGSNAYEERAYEDYLKSKMNRDLTPIATWTTASGWMCNLIVKTASVKKEQ